MLLWGPYHTWPVSVSRSHRYFCLVNSINILNKFLELGQSSDEESSWDHPQFRQELEEQKLPGHPEVWPICYKVQGFPLYLKCWVYHKDSEFRKKTTHNFIIAKGQNEKQFPKEMRRKTGKFSEVTLLCFLPLASGWITFLAKQSIMVSQETCLSFIVHSEFLWAGGQDDSADNGTCWQPGSYSQGDNAQQGVFPTSLRCPEANTLKHTLIKSVHFSVWIEVP